MKVIEKGGKFRRTHMIPYVIIFSWYEKWWNRI